MAKTKQRVYRLENDLVRFTLSLADNAWSLLDRRANISWGDTGKPGPWLLVHRRSAPNSNPKPLFLAAIQPGEDELTCQFKDQKGKDGRLALVIRLKGEALQVFVLPDERLAYASIELFASGLGASQGEDGEAFAPVRTGLLLPAAGKKGFSLKFGTYEYEGVHLAMAGLFKSGAVLMADWGDPYVTLNLSRTVKKKSQAVRMSFSLAKSARSLELRCLGKGDLAVLADAYRARARSLGYRVTWEEKLKTRPQAARLFGACNVKLWTALARHIDKEGVEQKVEVHWTFDEAARIAEHLKNDLQLSDVLFHLGGWTRYGYDCRHPDIQPANPECGGDEGLADCARRVQAAGYLFCLHDNYQDMYRDAPSFNESWLQKGPDGSPTLGGVWLGGQAYLTCAREALRLARRQQNLPWVQKTFHPDLYFIDTTYAAGPQECFDPRHPLTKQDDIHWKAALSDYARDVVGMFGSECGREWAVPHADFFEGLASVAGQYDHLLKPDELNATVVPFFDMIFHDCIVIHGKYGYHPAEMAEQVLHHISLGRALYYHALGDHLYWQDPAGLAEAPAPQGPLDPALFTRAHQGWAEGLCLWDRFMKNTHEVLGPLAKRTAQALIERYDFLDPARLVRQATFGNGATTLVNASTQDITIQSGIGGEVVLPPYGFLIEAGDFMAFHARSWNGLAYAEPALFTLTSQDGQPLSDAGQVRIFHAFGDPRLAWRGATVEVAREVIVS